MADSRFCGCLANRAIMEYRDRNRDICAASATAGHMLERQMEEWCRSAGIDDPTRMAAHLYMLFEGAGVLAQAKQSPEPYYTARSIAETLLAMPLDR